MAKHFNPRARGKGRATPPPRVIRSHSGRGGMLEGILRLTRQGYAFLETPPDPAAGPADGGGRDDVKIAADRLGGALHGDKVRVRVMPARPGERRRGAVTGVLARARARFVAVTISATRVVPEDERNPYEFLLDVSDPALPQDLAPGLKVLAEIVVWPEADADPDDTLPVARLIEVLGPAGAADTETGAILANLGIETEFDEAALAEARAMPESIPAYERARRLDCTTLDAVTIDPVDARDFDDALSFEILPNGNRRVGVHIADVSFAVPAGSLLDEVARDRGVSVYLPDRAIPMLPEEIANDFCSLRPNEERLAKTVFIEFTPEGERVRFAIHRSVIRSVRRFTYEEVRDLLDPGHIRAPLPEIIDPEAGVPAPALAPASAIRKGESVALTKKTSRSGRYKAHGTPPEPSEALLATLRGLDELAQTLRRRRFAAGAVELDLYDIRVRIDPEGRVLGIERQVQDFSHQLVEEFMLAANQALGEWAVEAGAGVLHRVHEAPAPERWAELCEYLLHLGITLKPPPDRRRLNAMLESVRGKPEARGVNMAVLRSFAQAHYAPEGTVGHFALAFPRYAHFTSPIRRYPDLHLHQVMDRNFPPDGNLLPRRAAPDTTPYADLVALGGLCSERERRAMKAEAETSEFRRLQWLAANEIGNELNATVTGVKRFGVFVEIDGYFVEGLLPKSMVEARGHTLREDPPPHPESAAAAPAVLAGREGGERAERRAGGARRRRHAGGPGFWLGQPLRVRVLAVDLADRQCRLALC